MYVCFATQSRSNSPLNPDKITLIISVNNVIRINPYFIRFKSRRIINVTPDAVTAPSACLPVRPPYKWWRAQIGDCGADWGGERKQENSRCRNSWSRNQIDKLFVDLTRLKSIPRMWYRDAAASSWPRGVSGAGAALRPDNRTSFLSVCGGRARPSPFTLPFI